MTGTHARIIGISLAGAEPDWGSEMMTSGGCVEPDLKQGKKCDDRRWLIPWYGGSLVEAKWKVFSDGWWRLVPWWS
jgi:hypothetical protein